MWYTFEPFYYRYYEPAFWKDTICMILNPEIFACNAKKVDYLCCPHIKFTGLEDPCPRKDRELKHAYPTELIDPNRASIILAFHYWFTELCMDTLYDIFPVYKDYRVFSLEATWNKGPYLRFHTCKKARRLHNIKVEAYGLGWVYLTWNTPKDNCLSKYYYDYDIALERSIDHHHEVGQYYSRYHWYEHNRVFACPRYPLKFCVFISDNVIPYKTLRIEIRDVRMEPDSVDISPWRTIEVTTDVKGKAWKYCPSEKFYESLWFAILLGLLFALLLALLIYMAVYLSRLKKDQLYGKKGGQGRSSSTLGKLWDRLRNFFNELCPRPNKPPPPKPRPKPKKKEKKKKKPKSKKSKQPKPQPDKYKMGRRERVAAVAPPKPKTRVRSPKGIRDMKQEKAAPPETAHLETKKAESAVGGGGSARRRPRR